MKNEQDFTSLDKEIRSLIKNQYGKDVFIIDMSPETAIIDAASLAKSSGDTPVSPESAKPFDGLPIGLYWAIDYEVEDGVISLCCDPYVVRRETDYEPVDDTGDDTSSGDTEPGADGEVQIDFAGGDGEGEDDSEGGEGDGLENISLFSVPKDLRASLNLRKDLVAEWLSYFKEGKEKGKIPTNWAWIRFKSKYEKSKQGRWTIKEDHK